MHINRDLKSNEFLQAFEQIEDENKVFSVFKNLKEPVLSENALRVLEQRYLLRDKNGDVCETPKELFWRVALNIAKIDLLYAKEGDINYVLNFTIKCAEYFYNMMVDFDFLPNSPTLMNAGANNNLGYMACYVLPVPDTMEGIFQSIKDAALIHKAGGGTGASFSRLRPKNSIVGSTGGVASGPLSFLSIFDAATEQVKQGGKRRGANMGILRIDHPDILEFIHAKEEEGRLANFNLSVALTEDFMEKVEKREDYPLIAPHTQAITGWLNAKEVFDILVKKAWQSGDPGIIFIDRINRDNPNPDQGEIESTNPCSELPLLPYEACNLGSINLGNFVTEGKTVDWNRLQTIIKMSTKFLDNVIDASNYPLEIIAETVRKNRKIGLGVMGWADMLFKLGIPYNSQRAIELGKTVMKFVSDIAEATSEELAKRRGNFPSHSTSIYANSGARRNATLTTVAPTGTLSIIANCSSGIEPLFALSFYRITATGDKLPEVNELFKQALKKEGLYTDKIMAQVTKEGSLKNIPNMPKSIKDVFVTAMEIDPESHLLMQAAFQEYVDNAISKTVNLPNSATERDIFDIYWLAYTTGCKGVTVYRDGCKNVQFLYTGDGAEEEKPEEEEVEVEVSPITEEEAKELVKEWKEKSSKILQEKIAEKINKSSFPVKRPNTVYGFTKKVKTGLGELYLTINEIDGKPFEVFATIGRSGRSITAKAEAIGRLVSLSLRYGIPVRAVVEQLKGIGGEHPVFQKKGMLLSIPDAIGAVLEKVYLKKENEKVEEQTDLVTPTCPDCGNYLVFQEGCFNCPSCSFTKCG